MCCRVLSGMTLSLKQVCRKGPRLFTMALRLSQNPLLKGSVSFMTTLRETKRLGTADLSVWHWSHSSSESGMQGHFKCAVDQSF